MYDDLAGKAQIASLYRRGRLQVNFVTFHFFFFWFHFNYHLWDGIEFFFRVRKQERREISRANKFWCMWWPFCESNLAQLWMWFFFLFVFFVSASLASAILADDANGQKKWFLLESINARLNLILSNEMWNAMKLFHFLLHSSNKKSFFLLFLFRLCSWCLWTAMSKYSRSKRWLSTWQWTIVNVNGKHIIESSECARN